MKMRIELEWLTCNHCGVDPVDWEDPKISKVQEAEEQLEAGWVEEGSEHFCPRCVEELKEVE